MKMGALPVWRRLTTLLINPTYLTGEHDRVVVFPAFFTVQGVAAVSRFVGEP